MNGDGWFELAIPKRCHLRAILLSSLVCWLNVSTRRELLISNRYFKSRCESLELKMIAMRENDVFGSSEF